MIEPPIVDDDIPAERARRGRLALVLSIALNLIGVLLFWRALAPPPEPPERRSRTEIVTIERKRPAPAPTPRPVVVRTQPVPRRVIPHPIVAAAPAPIARAPKPTPVRPPPRAIPHPAELAKNGGGAHVPPQQQPPRPGADTSKRTQLSAQKIAQITQDLQGEIDADRASHGTSAALAVAPAPAPTMKKFAMDIGDLTAGGLSHHGLCDPVKDWQEDGYDYYYVACNVRFSDGTFERQPVPWPVRFPPNDDPFNGTAHRDKPLAPPLPGWHLPPGETVTVELREYAHDHGVDI